MKTILIACAMTIAVSTSAMASAVPDLDAVSAVNSKNADVIQVTDKQADKEMAYAINVPAAKKHKRMKSAKDKRHTTQGTAKTGTRGRMDYDMSTTKRKRPHYKRKSPRQCKKGQTGKC